MKPHHLIALAMLSMPVAHAQSTAAVLMIEDAGYPGAEVTERIGDALYGNFLDRAGYARVVRIFGRGEDPNGKLARAINEAAAQHDFVDVFCSVHTTTRDPETMQRLIPARSRKLRLVYSTACYGAQEERLAWVKLGARTVVTHQGINNPVVALPLILGRWIGGGKIGDAVTDAYRETLVGSHFILSLPGVSGAVSGFDPRGSRPVVTGDRNLTIGHARQLGRDLTYDRRRGGPIGLALRGLAGRFAISGEEIDGLMARISLPAVLPAEAIREVKRAAAGLDGSEGRLELALKRRVDVPTQGVTLRVATDVTLKPGEVDVNSRKVVVDVTGISVKKGIFSLRLRRLTLSPDGANGYKVKASAGLWGFIPVWKTFKMGGTPPLPVNADDVPVFVDRGLEDALLRAPIARAP